jgi:hypothetical protein
MEVMFMKWHDPAVYDACFLEFIARKHVEYLKKAIATQVLGDMFLVWLTYGEHAKNVQPQSLVVLVEAAQLLYDKFIEEMDEGRDESQVSLALENILSEILGNPELEILWKEKREEGGYKEAPEESAPEES